MFDSEKPYISGVKCASVIQVKCNSTTNDCTLSALFRRKQCLFFLKRLGITFINGNGDNEMRMAARHDSLRDWILGLCLLLNVTCHCFLHKNISGIWFSSISANAHSPGLFLSRTLFENTSTLTWTYCHEDNLYRVLISSKNNLRACFMLYAFMPPPLLWPTISQTLSKWVGENSNMIQTSVNYKSCIWIRRLKTVKYRSVFLCLVLLTEYPFVYIFSWRY